MEKRKNSKGHLYNNCVNGIKVIYFDLNLNKKDLANLRHRGRNVRGLVKIILNIDSKRVDYSSKIYNIKFEGRVNVDNPDEMEKSEIEKSLREHYNEISRNSMRKIREKIYNKQIEKYFPRKELEKKLNNITESKTNHIPVGALKHLIYRILDEKGVSLEEKKSINYESNVWKKTRKEFMLERGYEKNGDKYVQIKK